MQALIEAALSHFGEARTRVLVITPPPVVEAMRFEHQVSPRDM